MCISLMQYLTQKYPKTKTMMQLYSCKLFFFIFDRQRICSILHFFCIIECSEMQAYPFIFYVLDMSRFGVDQWSSFLFYITSLNMGFKATSYFLKKKPTTGRISNLDLKNHHFDVYITLHHTQIFNKVKLHITGQQCPCCLP